MRVRGAMVDMIRRTIPMSRGSMERRKQLRGAEDALRARLGRDPDQRELAEELGMAPADLASLRAGSSPLRFEAIDEVYSDSDACFADESPDSLEQLVDEELRGRLVEAIAALSERLKLVVSLYFVEELNLSEIAEVLKVSIPRVHQLKAQALAHLRKHMENFSEIL